MEEKRCYTVKDLQDILGISRPTVYELLKKNEFRWIQIGTKYRISKKSFDEWRRAGAGIKGKIIFFHGSSKYFGNI